MNGPPREFQQAETIHAQSGAAPDHQADAVIDRTLEGEVPARRTSALGRYAHLGLSSSDDFARQKQEEIDREDRPVREDRLPLPSVAELKPPDATPRTAPPSATGERRRAR